MKFIYDSSFSAHTIHRRAIEYGEQKSDNDIATGEHAYKSPKEDPCAKRDKDKAEKAVENAIRVAIGAVKYF